MVEATRKVKKLVCLSPTSIYAANSMTSSSAAASTRASIWSTCSITASANRYSRQRVHCCTGTLFTMIQEQCLSDRPSNRRQQCLPLHVAVYLRCQDTHYRGVWGIARGKSSCGTGDSGPVNVRGFRAAPPGYAVAGLPACTTLLQDAVLFPAVYVCCPRDGCVCSWHTSA
jgi:hypothetical protein